jgi:ribose transport system permease protein
MLAVLVILAAFFSVATFDERRPRGARGGEVLTETLLEGPAGGGGVVIVAGGSEEDAAFAQAIETGLAGSRWNLAGIVRGEPADLRREIERLIASGTKVSAFACTEATSKWSILEDRAARFPGLGSSELVVPESYSWPTFLETENLLNIASQIAVIAIIAIGMTLVIITAGIDLSVGSLIALSAVVTAWLVRSLGARDAGIGAMLTASIAGALLAALVGAFSGAMVTLLAIPPFIVTLAMMLVASGLAFIIAEGQSIYEVPDSFVWLGRGADFFGVPNAVVLMVVLYIAAHVLMSRTALGRYIYAVGGNPEAAYLSGVPVRRVILFVYSVSGLLAGLGGVITASQLKSGSPTYGAMYELYVIAAVVVGGTSLSGGRGKVFGTLIGAFIIAVIQNGMNLTGIESYTQKVVLGLVIFGAVLIDTLKRGVRRRR